MVNSPVHDADCDVVARLRRRIALLHGHRRSRDRRFASAVMGPSGRGDHGPSSSPISSPTSPASSAITAIVALVSRPLTVRIERDIEAAIGPRHALDHADDIVFRRA
jgi:hypothetical protein